MEVYPSLNNYMFHTEKKNVLDTTIRVSLVSEWRIAEIRLHLVHVVNQAVYVAVGEILNGIMMPKLVFVKKIICLMKLRIGA
jgi:hypothetical protein